MSKYSVCLVFHGFPWVLLSIDLFGSNVPHHLRRHQLAVQRIYKTDCFSIQLCKAVVVVAFA